MLDGRRIQNKKFYPNVIINSDKNQRAVKMLYSRYDEFSGHVRAEVCDRTDGQLRR